MKPWIIERIEKDKAQPSWERVPLRIQPPPPEWIEQEQRRHERSGPSERGISILGEDEGTERGVLIIDL
jgi:hypothetical protein